MEDCLTWQHQRRSEIFLSAYSWAGRSVVNPTVAKAQPSHGTSTDAIGFVTTSSYQVALFLRPHLKALPTSIEHVIFTNATDAYASLVSDLVIHHVPIGRERRLTPADVKAGASLARQFRSKDVGTVITMSPKAGFIGQCAAAVAGIERRAHIFTGQVWVDMPRGGVRLMARAADRAIGHIANHIAADSPSQAKFLHDEGVVPRRKPVVVPHPPGSIRGVDLSTFRQRGDVRSSLRAVYGLDEEAVAFVQVGRLARSKGVLELADAFDALRHAWRAGDGAREPHLFLVGHDEDMLAPALESRDGVTVLPFTPEPEFLLAAMDVLVLASHREGFGSTIIEAAAVGIPAIGTDIVGVRDAVEDGVTGWLVPLASPHDLHEAMARALGDEAERQRRGAAAQDRVRRLFAAQTVSRAYAAYVMGIHGRGR
jgi:glycosyltransferase involved in cell wall biosynthesis